MNSFFSALARKKALEDDTSDKPKLKRVLTLLDLTGLGVGSTLGLGVYVLAGAVAKDQAGPAVIISFLVAAIASAFAGVCYAEFAARVPKAGSAYVYSYVSVGEGIAFIIGWNLILEYVIGTASVARGLSNYVDSLSNNTMRDYLTSVMPLGVDFLSEYPDFLSFILVMILAGILAFGVKESTTLNNIFTAVNMVVIGVVVIAGATKADTANWNLPAPDPDQYPNAGSGGFMPFGFAGIMAGAAKCFFGFVGFDCVATTGEEAINPKKNIPLSIVLSLIIIFLSYFSISTIITLMLPYYLQDADAPFPHVFDAVDLPAIKWIVTIGAIFALCTSLLGAMFPLPRVLYAMGSDGIIFRTFSNINGKTQTPLLATFISGLGAGIMAMLFNLNQLIDMMSIGTLLAYTIVAVCVLLLRYEEPIETKVPLALTEDMSTTAQSKKWLASAFNVHMQKIANEDTSVLTKWVVGIFFILGLAFMSVVMFSGAEIEAATGWAIFLTVLFGCAVVMCLLILYRQPQSSLALSFKVPFVPILPAVSVLINIYLMLQLDQGTWIRFGVWLIVGFLIYFTYGIRNSSARVSPLITEKPKNGQSTPPSASVTSVATVSEKL